MDPLTTNIYECLRVGLSVPQALQLRLRPVEEPTFGTGPTWADPLEADRDELRAALVCAIDAHGKQLGLGLFAQWAFPDLADEVLDCADPVHAQWVVPHAFQRLVLTVPSERVILEAERVLRLDGTQGVLSPGGRSMCSWLSGNLEEAEAAAYEALRSSPRGTPIAETSQIANAILCEIACERQDVALATSLLVAATRALERSLPTFAPWVGVARSAAPLVDGSLIRNFWLAVAAWSHDASAVAQVDKCLANGVDPIFGFTVDLPKRAGLLPPW